MTVTLRGGPDAGLAIDLPPGETRYLIRQAPHGDRRALTGTYLVTAEGVAVWQGWEEP